MSTLSIRLPADLLAELRTTSLRDQVSMNELVTRALRAMLSGAPSNEEPAIQPSQRAAEKFRASLAAVLDVPIEALEAR